MKAVTYYRVSTAAQGVSGLGLEAQKAAVKKWCGGRCEVVAEFVEVESGKKNNRPQLLKALATAKAQGATLVVAKLDRLSRNAAFLLALRDSGVNFIACDNPEATPLTVGIMAVIAQDERERISSRTKSALAAKKARGATLGKPENMSHAAQVKGAKARQDAAKESYKPILNYVKLMLANGDSLSRIAWVLNKDGITTLRGGEWSAQQVKRVAAYID